LVDGPNGEPNGALSFNGDEEFAYIPHTKATMITQGTIALWVQPQDLDDCEIILSKDQKNTGDGGHFRLGHSDDGGLFIRMAPGDGSSNRAWETHHQVLEEGEWAHIAVNFTATGVTVFVNGEAIPDGMWRPKEGDDPSPGSYLEAYILNNQEPWVLGADQARTEVNDTAQIFALDDEDLANAFEGAVAGFGVWGGMDADDALTQAEIQQLIADGPGAALTNPSGPQPIIASDDTFSGGAGDDTIKGDAGDDTLNGGDDDDLIYGGYGDDLIDGGDGNDTIDGGRGSDLVMGGAGDDVLISRSDVGEDRAGQLVLGEPSRAFPDPQIDPELLKLADWIDQPLVADDILVGGEGADHFQIETLINGTMESIMDNLFGGTRVVRWHGVAGENARIHDHWVDGIGIDIIADFEADKDHISIIGHTTEIDIHYQSVDTNGDDVVDSVVSVITVYSQQGNNGGAHDEDILGYVVVHGDVVTEDMVETDAGAHYGIVHTIDELQEALAPNGETKISTGPNGEELFGYDSRDVDGDPIGSDPEAYSSNPYKDLVSYDDQTVQVDPFAVLVEYESGSFDGETAVTIAHQDGHSPEEGTIALTFTAEEIGPTQALYSKDHNGYEDGGHLTIWLDHKGKVNVRIQDQNNSYYLRSDDHRVEAGEETNIAFSFDGESLLLFVNGELADAEDGFEGGMSGNAEDAVLGASTRHRRGDDDKLDWFFTGAIANLFFIDRPITTDEAMLLAAGGGELDVLALNVSDPADDPQPDDGDPPEDDPVGDDPADDDDGSDDGETGDDESDDDDNADGDGEDGDAEDGDDDGGDDGDDDEPEVADDPIITAGTGGADEIEGGSGADDLSGRGGADTVMGGEGADTIKGGAGADDLSGGEDGDIIRGQAGRDAISGDEGDDRLLGGGGADTLNGGADRDKLLGGGGRDQLFGGEGMDTLKGGGGADTLDGGEGRDIYVGGGGADVFVFGDDGAKNVVRDYRDGRDKIQIDSEVAASFGDLDIQTKGKHVVVSYGDTEVLVRKTDEADLDANDFIF
ncbi:MAG: LamG-like jellyroll fold domain-containing protein, partial [Pseudomonadota bacterium]